MTSSPANFMASPWLRLPGMRKAPALFIGWEEGVLTWFSTNLFQPHRRHVAGCRPEVAPYTRPVLLGTSPAHRVCRQVSIHPRLLPPCAYSANLCMWRDSPRLPRTGVSAGSFAPISACLSWCSSSPATSESWLAVPCSPAVKGEPKASCEQEQKGAQRREQHQACPQHLGRDGEEADSLIPPHAS